MIEIQVNNSPDGQWNKRLINSRFGTIYQSEEIAKYFNLIGEKPQFLTFVNNAGAIVGQLLLNVIPRFKNAKGVKLLIGKLPVLQKNLLQWTYGPVILDTNFTNDIYYALGKFLISKKSKVSGWQHPLLTDGVDSIRKDFTVNRWSTFLINLKQSKEEVYNNIEKHNGRKNIERSIKRGVQIEQIDENSLLEYSQLKNNMKDEENPEDFTNLLNWWRLLKPLGYSGYIARKDGIPIGGLLFSYLCGFIIEGGVARSEKDRNENLYSQDLIKWTIIQWGIENNMEFYNLAGFNPSPQNKKEEGIFQYKKKWGGKICDYWRIRM